MCTPSNKINFRGVQKGKLSADYKLLAHCQCSSTESPGKKLFQKLTTLDHFTNMDQLTSDSDDVDD